MKRTVRFAHLEFAPLLCVGDSVSRGDVVGVMGSSGQSTAPHLHIDLVDGEQATRYTLADIEAGEPIASNPRQLNYFIDEELFGISPIITTFYADVAYQVVTKKVHYGYDVVPVDRHETREHFEIHWPRSQSGRVTRIDFDHKGYGHCLYVVFEA